MLGQPAAADEDDDNNNLLALRMTGAGDDPAAERDYTDDLEDLVSSVTLHARCSLRRFGRGGEGADSMRARTGFHSQRISSRLASIRVRSWPRRPAPLLRRLPTSSRHRSCTPCPIFQSAARLRSLRTARLQSLGVRRECGRRCRMATTARHRCAICSRPLPLRMLSPAMTPATLTHPSHACRREESQLHATALHPRVPAGFP